MPFGRILAVVTQPRQPSDGSAGGKDNRCVSLVCDCPRNGSEPSTLDLVANLGVNGYTSGDLIRDQTPALDALGLEFATVLIGVNDVVQGVAMARYETNVMTILDGLLGRLDADRIVTVAIPDYTVTPAGGATATRAGSTTRSWPPTRRCPGWLQIAGSPTSIRSTPRSGPRTTAPSSRKMACTRAVRSTGSGSTRSLRSWSVSSAASARRS